MMKLINADALTEAFIERSKYTAFAPFSLKEITNEINKAPSMNAKYLSLLDKYATLLDKCAALQKENQQLRAIINAPDLDYPNSTKGGTGDSVTPTNFTEFD